MTCSFCGSILDDDEVECPYCGHKTGIEQVQTPQESYDTIDVQEENFDMNGEEAYPEGDYPEENYRDDNGFEEEFDEGTDNFEPEQLYRKPSNSVAASNSGKKNAKGKFSIPKLNLKDGLDKLKKSGANSRDQSSDNTQSGASAVSSSGRRTSSLKANPAMINLIVMGACALLSLISLFSVISLSSKVEKNQQAVLSQMMQMQNNEQQMASQINDLGNKVGNVSTTITEQATSKSITITKEPTSSSTYLGRGGTEDSTQNVPIFTVTATGYDLSFTWQRLDEISGGWVDLVFDADSNNTTYGLHLYTDLSKGYSELSAHGVNADAYGSYRCQISDAYGTKNTDTVILSERSNA